ncbi:MAG: hypothetical protein AAGM67_07715 [Bacteroidota bacterium]
MDFLALDSFQSSSGSFRASRNDWSRSAKPRGLFTPLPTYSPISIMRR